MFGVRAGEVDDMMAGCWSLFKPPHSFRIKSNNRNNTMIQIPGKIVVAVVAFR